MSETTSKGLREAVLAKLAANGIASPESANEEQWYTALVGVLRERLREGERAFSERRIRGGKKRVAYLCMEFLLGRSLKKNLETLGLFSEARDLLGDYGHTFEEIFAVESDPGLGNGGLGRLAACFLDSLSALSYPAIGYSLLYEAGLFRQKIVEGAQVELPDEWIPTGGAWLIPRPDLAVSVRFGGRIGEAFENGRLHITHTEYDEVRAIPYDILIPGDGGRAVNVLRLFRARDAVPPPSVSESQSDYLRALRSRSAAEELTRQLYPPDNHEEGKLLRLSQQYLLVSAALQNLIAEHFAEGGSLGELPERLALHLNDTHPAVAIPELMRLLLDVYSYSWEDAWQAVTRMVSYTNHTVLPEALECWRAEYFRVKLPRLYAILLEIDRRHTEALWARYPGDWDRISRMAIVAYGQVRMANLSVVAAHTVNGVSRLHGEILRETVFADFCRATPEKFTSVTNGVAHRRWLMGANPALAALLDETIGRDYREEPWQLAGLLDHRGDTALLDRLSEIKEGNKRRFSDFMVARAVRPLDHESVYDVQIKRMHEYKRQLLNVLKILSLMNDPRSLPGPVTFIFGAKAAPGYYMAKEILRLVVALGEELEASPLRDVLRVVFLEDYNVTSAEVLIPAGELSEQISLAGKEASGTGCMKLMMNGALTLGTRDGANVEILEAVGEENMYTFGLDSREVEGLWRMGYDARAYYRASPRLAAAVDRLYHKIGGRDFSHIGEYLIGSAHGLPDPYMCLADFESYRTTFDRALGELGDKRQTAARSLVNIARSGRVSADVSVREYADRIWHITPLGGEA